MEPSKKQLNYWSNNYCYSIVLYIAHPLCMLDQNPLENAEPFFECTVCMIMYENAQQKLAPKEIVKIGLCLHPQGQPQGHPHP
jgi:hypothetical protein